MPETTLGSEILAAHKINVCGDSSVEEKGDLNFELSSKME